MNKFVKSAGVATLCLPVLLATAGPADAGTRWTYRSSGVSVEVDFLVVGTAEGVDGNAHVGHLSTSSDGGVWGYIDDWTCPEGERPPYYGGGIPIDGREGGGDDGDGGDEPIPEPETNCVLESSRQLGSEEPVEVKVDKKLTSASVAGTLTEWRWSEGEEGSTGASAVDLTFTGEGAAWTETSYSKDKTSTFKYESTHRYAIVSGTLGGLSLDEAEFSDGQLRSYQVFERYNSGS